MPCERHRRGRGSTVQRRIHGVHQKDEWFVVSGAATAVSTRRRSASGEATTTLLPRASSFPTPAATDLRDSASVNFFGGPCVAAPNWVAEITAEAENRSHRTKDLSSASMALQSGGCGRS